MISGGEWIVKPSLGSVLVVENSIVTPRLDSYCGKVFAGWPKVSVEV